MNLVIVESPAKARTIRGILGEGYEVLASFGHIRDLPRKAEEVPPNLRGTHGRLVGVDPNQNFDAVYVVPPEKEQTVRALRDAARHADRIYLATDGDREGEAIAWHIVEAIEPASPCERMVFHEITSNAILEAVQNTREIDMNLVAAQEARRVVDRLVGYEISPLLWRQVGPFARSAGRVQSVAVKLLVEREKARMGFVPVGWTSVNGVFSQKDVRFEAELVELDGQKLTKPQNSSEDSDTAEPKKASSGKTLTNTEAKALVADLKKNFEFEIESVESSPFSERPWAPFTTSSLQQEASYKLKMSPEQTMKAAQSLYERGYITYMRTDSVHINAAAAGALQREAKSIYGDDATPDKIRGYATKSKNAQEAHEAIRPSGKTLRHPDSLGGKLEGRELDVYRLIWNRSIASQMKDAQGTDSEIIVRGTRARGSGAVRTVRFRSRSRVFNDLGYKVVTGRDDEKSAPTKLPTEGAVALDQCTSKTHQTRPPNRFSEARLVKELEDLGVGRPSTYAATIKTIQERGYCKKTGQNLVPTWSGFLVIAYLEQHFGPFVDYEFTARMEGDLDEVAQGKESYKAWLSRIYFGTEQTSGLQNLALEGARDVTFPFVDLGTSDAGAPVVLRAGLEGPYIETNGKKLKPPMDTLPDDLLDAVHTMPVYVERGMRIVGNHPQDGMPLFLRADDRGPYIQKGNESKRARLLASMHPERVTPEIAAALYELPKLLGKDAQGKSITALPGRYGSYLERSDGEKRNLRNDEEIFSITIEDAIRLFAAPRIKRS